MLAGPDARLLVKEDPTVRIASIAAAAAISLVLASPALAQMKMSAPAKPQTMAGPAGDPYLSFWPGSTVPGVAFEEARVMEAGKALYTIGGLGAGLGLGGGMEGRGGLTLNLSTAPSWLLAPSATAKYVFMQQGNMSVAAGGTLGLSSSNGTPFDLNAAAFVPISFWKLGPGDLHVIPAFSIPTFTTAGAFAAPLSWVSVSAAYIYPLNPKWSLVLADTVSLAPSNTLSLGGRVKFNQNLYLDVTPIAITGGTLGIGLLGVTGHWGSTPADLLKGIGL